MHIYTAGSYGNEDNNTHKQNCGGVSLILRALQEKGLSHAPLFCSHHILSLPIWQFLICSLSSLFFSLWMALLSLSRSHIHCQPCVCVPTLCLCPLCALGIHNWMYVLKLSFQAFVVDAAPFISSLCRYKNCLLAYYIICTSSPSGGGKRIDLGNWSHTVCYSVAIVCTCEPTCHYLDKVSCIGDLQIQWNKGETFHKQVVRLTVPALTTVDVYFKKHYPPKYL